VTIGAANDALTFDFVPRREETVGAEKTD
jgi:hypothetical protein